MSDKQSDDVSFDSEKTLQQEEQIRIWRMTLAVHFSNLLYSAAFWIQIGINPYIIKSLNVDVVTYGYLQTAFSGLQLLGGPVYGRLGDIFGSRRVLILAHTCAFLMYCLNFLADNTLMLFLARLPGLLLHGAQGAQMAITDVTSHKERAVALGKLSFSYGLGVILGPFLGGQISKYSSQKITMLFAAALSAFAVVFINITLSKLPVKSDQERKDTSSLLDAKRISNLMSIPSVRFLYVMKLISGLPFAIFQSMFSVIVVNSFGFTAAQNGAFMSYVGLIMILVQGVAVGFVTKHMNDKKTLVLSMVASSFGYFIWCYSTKAVHLCILVIPLMFGGGLFSVITNSILTKVVPADDTGFALGLSFATHSLLRTLSPTLGGLLLANFGYTSLGGFGCVVCIGSALYIFTLSNVSIETNKST